MDDDDKWLKMADDMVKGVKGVLAYMTLELTLGVLLLLAGFGAWYVK